MGCDIHFFAEKREHEGAPWQFLPAPDGPGVDPEDVQWPYRYDEGEGGYESRGRFLRDWFDDRNYRLFGKLANVRNFSHDVEPISEPRGWPRDLSPELEAERSMIEHSATWLTVAEMLAHFDSSHETYYRRFRLMLREMVDAASVSPDNIRAVFYFDS